MRFVDLLRTTVMLSAGAATLLAALTLAGAGAEQDDRLVFVSAGWWLAAGLIGTWVGRRNAINPPIARLLAEAKAATMLPEHRPASVVVNRLWPVLVAVVAAGGSAFVLPQIAGVATGFCVIWSLAWRRQDAAVTAIEERDGVTFYVDHTSPLRPVELLRTPGFRREVPTLPAQS